MTDRGDPLSTITNEVMSKQCWTRWTWTSEFQLPHSVVKQLQSTSVRQLIQKIENHPNRHALQQGLRQNQSFNPLSRIKTHDSGCWGHRIMWIARDGPHNPVQSMPIIMEWRHRLLHMRASLDRNTVANRGFIENTLDLLSIPEYVIKKGRPHGHRYGKKPGSIDNDLANNLKKRFKKRDYEGIHDRFLRDHVFRGWMMENSRDEDVCRAWDVLADEDHSCRMSQEEYFYYRNKLWHHLNKSGDDTLPLRKRSDFKQAFSSLERLHQEAGREQIEPIPYWKYKQCKPASSSCSTWWQDSWWSSWEFTESQGRGKHGLVTDRGNPLSTVLWRKLLKMAFKNFILFLLQINRLQLTSV